MPMKIKNFCLLINKETSNIMFSFMINSLIGLVMFFIRSCETNFYSVLDCHFFTNSRIDELDKDNKKQKTLISMISANMNLEFMCCILYGLSDIFHYRKYRKDKYEFLKNDFIESTKLTFLNYSKLC